jgi:hypothetical protein
MTESLRKLIKFFKENNPESHYSVDNNSPKFWACIGMHEASDFLELIDYIDDGGYECSWMGSYFGVDLTDYIESICEIELEDFCLILDIEKE